MTSPDLDAGASVRVEMTKWGDRPHWAFDAVWLGTDVHGAWIGIPSGTPMARPGASLVTETAQVGLVPADAGWLATFHAPGYVVATYVDMTSVPVWDLAAPVPTCRAVDLDLDVIEMPDGRVVVDDEDEFAEHRVTLGYPPEVVSLAETSCAWVAGSVSAGSAPFDGVAARRWFDLLASLGG
ncbi:DUF402 domain-containing protein [Nocardioides litoris]|uniref:DUF402 domain-containing protein n=1 Tax=Nocardioides litoris TaxID=1926648 RepID=UPI00111F0AC0|nr:DUF402 domain-containing protein [Nocardioides litoris]